MPPHDGLIFIGDIHRRWDLVARGLAGLPSPPRHIVLLGDMECHEPLDRLTAPLRAHGTTLHWIHGNHDADGGREMWNNLTEPTRNPLTTQGALHGRVIELAGLRIAGLGGTFNPRVWHPPKPPRLHARADLPADLATIGPGWTADSTAALAFSLATLAIWPEDVAALAAQRADILVTHEAPSSHPAGAAVLDDLARAMGASLIIHGHHHIGYRAAAPDGLQAQGVAAAWGTDLHGQTLWPGEKQRAMHPPLKGWTPTAETGGIRFHARSGAG